MQPGAEAVVTTVREQPTRIRWLMIGMIFVVDVLMFIDRVNISIAAKYIIPEYGLTEVQMGSVFSAFVLGYALLQIPGGWLGDRFGPRRVLAVAIFWWSVFTAVTAVAGELFLVSIFGTVGSFIVVRVLIGAGEAAALPNRNRLVANWIPPHERALAIGIGGSGSMLGAALTPPLIVAIMLTLGWRAAFYLAGAAGIGLAVVWYWLARDRPEQHPWLNHTELRYITQGTEESVLAYSDTARSNPWPVLLRSKSLWCVTAAYFTIGYIAYLYFSWFYLYLVNVRGFSLTHGGLYGSLPFLTAAVVAPLAGWLSDHLSQRYGKRTGRCMLGIIGLLLGAGWICAGAAATHPLWAVVFLSLGAGSLFLGVPAYFATTIDLAKTHAGIAGGFMNMGGNLGGALSPTLTPLLAHHFGWDGALYASAALAFVGALFWLGVHPEQEIDFRKEG
jgi:ACS family glucarate transporter-like MFS transporter